MKMSAKQIQLIALVSLAICSACTPKYDINYSYIPPLKTKPELAASKIGICTFEDVRPSGKPDYRFFQDTWTTSDDLFTQKVPTMINTTMVKHFNSVFGTISSAVKIEQNCTNKDIKTLISTIDKQHRADYILVGTISQFKSRLHDNNAVARDVVGLIPGFVLLFANEVENKTDIELNNLLLIKVDGPQIVWRGSYKSNTTEAIRVYKDRYEYLASTFEKNTNLTIRSILESILLSADQGFPQKLSVEESRRIVNKIKVNKSLSNITF